MYIRVCAPTQWQQAMGVRHVYEKLNIQSCMYIRVCAPTQRQRAMGVNDLFLLEMTGSIPPHRHNATTVNLIWTPLASIFYVGSIPYGRKCVQMYLGSNIYIYIYICIYIYIYIYIYMFKPIWLPNCMLKYIYVLKSIWAVKYLWARINMGLHIYIYMYVLFLFIYI